MERRRTEGLSKKDVLRCLKRFIAREVYHALEQDLLKNWPLTFIGTSLKRSISGILKPETDLRNLAKRYSATKTSLINQIIRLLRFFE
jgi:hypothetical protein